MSDTETPISDVKPAAGPDIALIVTVAEGNLILAALQELPHRVVDPLLRKILEQAKASVTDVP